jgi:FtsH-binding integral membrane protein
MKPILEYRKPSTEPKLSNAAGLISVITGVMGACPIVLLWLPGVLNGTQKQAMQLIPPILLLTGCIFGGMAIFSQTSNRKLGWIGLAINGLILVCVGILVCRAAR